MLGGGEGMRGMGAFLKSILLFLPPWTSGLCYHGNASKDVAHKKKGGQGRFGGMI